MVLAFRWTPQTIDDLEVDELAWWLAVAEARLKG